MQIQGIFFCDVDGTLLPYGEHVIPEDFFTTVLAAKERGFLTVISSGRVYSTLHPLFTPVRDQVIFSASNGSLILQHDTELLPPRVLDSEDLGPLIADLAAAGASPLISTMDGLHLQSSSEEHSLTLRYMNLTGTRYFNSLSELQGPVLQMTGLCHSPLESVLSYMRERWGERYHITASGRQMFDISPTNKGESLVAITEHLQVAQERTWAFGDNENDFQMLKAAGTAYLMADANPALHRPSFLRTSDVSATIRSIITGE